jgi:exosortase/archaeosortase family protein
LRKLTGTVVSFVLTPYRVRLEGTILRAGNCILDVDAPCSGIRGLTLFLLAGAVIALARKEKLQGLAFMLGGSFVCALFYNILRSTWLFMIQYHTGGITDFAHNAIGAAAFAAGIAALFGLSILSDRVFRRGRAS